MSKRVVLRCMLSSHYLETVERIATAACNLGWDLVSISPGKLGSLSINQYLITIKAIVDDGASEPPLPKDWKTR